MNVLPQRKGRPDGRPFAASVACFVSRFPLPDRLRKVLSVPGLPSCRWLVFRPRRRSVDSFFGLTDEALARSSASPTKRLWKELHSLAALPWPSPISCGSCIWLSGLRRRSGRGKNGLRFGFANPPSCHFVSLGSCLTASPPKRSLTEDVHPRPDEHPQPVPLPLGEGPRGAGCCFGSFVVETLCLRLHCPGKAVLGELGGCYVVVCQVCLETGMWSSS